MSYKQNSSSSKSLQDTLKNHKIRTTPKLKTSFGDERKNGTDYSDEARIRIERIQSKLVNKKEPKNNGSRGDSEDEEIDIQESRLEQERREERKRKMEQIRKDIRCVKRDLQRRKRKLMENGEEEDNKTKREVNEVRNGKKEESKRHK